MSPTDWSPEQHTIARQAFELGNKRSVEHLINTLKEQTKLLDNPESVWKLHDYLSTERYQYEGRSEYNEGDILFVLAEMIKQNLITLGDLKGLDDRKITKIKAMSIF